MSLQTIVHPVSAGRLWLRRSAARAAVAPPRSEIAVDGRRGSMRGLETVLALASIGTALLVGLGR